MPASPLFAKDHDAFLFDMDGTLLNSIAIVERIWRRWADRMGLDGAALLKNIHGMRAVDVVRALNLDGIDPVAEAAELLRQEMEDVEGIIPIPGAIAFLNGLPEDRWAIVTSAPRALAELRMKAAGIPQPRVTICAEDIVLGKPNPQGYIKGATALGTSSKHCVVFEDAPAGILAGENAGADVVVITTTHSSPHVFEHPAIPGYERLQVLHSDNGKLQLTLSS